MDNKYFTINNFPDDIYSAVGKIIHYAQELEHEYKTLPTLLNLNVKGINKSTLNKLNEALKKNNIVDEYEYNNLKNVIKYRNDINHNFFLKDFQQEYANFDQKLADIEYKLNIILYAIFEATDFIDNKIDELKGNTIARPSIINQKCPIASTTLL